MSVLDKLSIGPARKVESLPDGNYLLTVTPPSWSGFSPSKIKLTPDQYSRFLKWVKSGDLLQNVFPDLSDEQREIIQTGIGPKEWDDAFKEEK